MHKPNFFIVGAPKCGTTALFTYLGEHPDIYVPAASNTNESQLGSKKELHFFGSDLAFKRPTLDDYLGYFSHARPEQLRGESSVFYLYSQRAAAEIQAFNPEARIIIMLRNPVDMMYSWYSQLSFWGDETLPTFEAALAAEPERQTGNQRPLHADHPLECFYYREIAKYTDQIQRYFDHFDREQIHIIIFDDFKQDTLGVYQGVTQFLGCQTAYQPEFKVVNANKTTRNRALQSFLRHPPKPIRQMTDLLVPVPARRVVRRTLQGYNMKTTTRNPLNPDFKSQLKQEFKPEIARLSDLLDRDFHPWVE